MDTKIGSLDRFRCHMCQEIEDFVYVCDRTHLVCEACFDKLESIPALCKCDNLLHSRKANPITVNVRETCEYRDAGCMWDFRHGEMQNHLLECRYRPYKCIGTTLNVWSCSWTGTQIELEGHFKSDHPELGDMLKHKEDRTLPFDPKANMGTVNLLSAFSRRFVFYFHTNSDKGMAYFCVFLLGKKSEAQRYIVDLSIYSTLKENEKIKYKLFCPSDVEDIRAMVAEERFVAISHQSLKKYLDEDNQIHFSFFVNHKAASIPTAANNLIPKKEDPNKKNDPKTDAKGPPGKPFKKGPNKATYNKKTSPPAGPTPSSGDGAKLLPPISQAPMHVCITTPLPEKQFNNAPNKALYNQKTPPPTGLPPSSDNGAKILPWNTQAPINAVSISTPLTPPQQRKPKNWNVNSDQVNTVEKSPACFSSASYSRPVTKQGMQMFQQPYKGVEQKYYKAKYPSSSIQKPHFKK